MILRYIQLYTTLLRHPKTRDLKIRLGLPTSHDAVKHLVCFWIWVGQFAPTGNLKETDLEPAFSEEGAGWQGDLDTLKNALVAAGWLDLTEDGYFVHKWDFYTKSFSDSQEKYERRKFLDREKSRRHYYRQKEIKELRESGRSSYGPDQPRGLRKSPTKKGPKKAEITPPLLGQNKNLTSDLTSEESVSREAYGGQTSEKVRTKNDVFDPPLIWSEQVGLKGESITDNRSDLTQAHLLTVSHAAKPYLTKEKERRGEQQQSSPPDVAQISKPHLTSPRELGVYFLDSYLKKVGQPCSSKGGAVIGEMKTLLKTKDGAVILRSIDFFFASDIPWVREIKWSLRGFSDKILNGELDNGPLIAYKSTGGVPAHEYDKPTEGFKTRSDF